LPKPNIRIVSKRDNFYVNFILINPFALGIKLRNAIKQQQQASNNTQKRQLSSIVVARCVLQASASSQLMARVGQFKRRRVWNWINKIIKVYDV